MRRGCLAAHSITFTFFDFVFDSFHEVRHTKGSLIAVFATAHGYFAGFFFSCAEHQHIGDLLQLGKANLSSDFVGRFVHGGPDLPIQKPIQDRSAIFEVLLGNGQDAHLLRRQPDRKTPGEMLNQNSAESFKRTERSTVNHDRSLG